MFSMHLFKAPFWVPFFLLLIASRAAFADDAIFRQSVEGGDFRSVHDALVEVIEAEGMVVAAVLPFGQMLMRTAEVSREPSPYREAEIVQFCSADLAHQMVLEDAGQIVFCPMSIAVYSTVENPAEVVMAYRSTGGGSPARQKAERMLARLVARAQSLGRLRW